MGLLSGLFGGSSSETTVPDWVRDPIERNVNRAERVADMGYVPYFGPDVAAFTPMQNAAFDGTNMAASAFGMPSATGNGMPEPKTYRGGIQGYSSGPLYKDALKRLERQNPKLYQALVAMNQPQMAQPQAPGQPNSLASLWWAMTNGDITKDQFNSMFNIGMIRPGSQGGGPASTRGLPTGSGGGTTSINTPLSYAPGGVNTANPGSMFNQTAAGLTGGFSFGPSRPVSNPRR